MREIRRTVKRIDMPAVARGFFGVATAFFGDDGVLREATLQARDDHGFRALIGFGDDVHFALVGDFLGAIEFLQKNRARFASGFYGCFKKVRGAWIGIGHRVIPRTSSTITPASERGILRCAEDDGALAVAAGGPIMITATKRQFAACGHFAKPIERYSLR